MKKISQKIKRKNHWYLLIILFIVSSSFYYFTSYDTIYQDYNSYNTISKINNNKSLFEHEETRIDKILNFVYQLLNEDILKIFFILFLGSLPILIFLILKEMRVEKIFIYLSYFLVVTLPLSFHITKLFSYISFEIFLFLLLILYYIKSLNKKKNIYTFIPLLAISIILDPHFFLVIFTIFISYFLSQIFEIKTTRFQREVSILVLILSITIFTLFYYNSSINYNFNITNLKLFLIIPLSIIGLVYAITNTKDLKFNSHYIFIISNMLLLLLLFIYIPNNLLIISLTYIILIIVSGLFFNWFNDFLDYTKFRKYKEIIILFLFIILFSSSVLVSYKNITKNNPEIDSYYNLSIDMNNLSINKYFLGDEKISSIYSYMYKRPVVNLISSKDQEFIKDYNSRKIATDKLYLLNKYDINYIDETFYYNDPTCLRPVLKYTSSSINKTIYEVRCHIKGIN